MISGAFEAILTSLGLTTIAIMPSYKNILLVDDHGITRAGAELHLRAIDPEITVHHAKNPEEAKHILSTRSIDLMFLDILFDGLPVGLDFLKQLKEGDLHDHIPVIIMSGETVDRKGIDNLLDMKAAGYLSKTSTEDADIFKIAMINIAAGAVFIHGARQGQSGAAMEVRTATSLGLTPSRQRVLVRLVKGTPYKTIAKQLKISEQTVKDHVSDILKHFGVPNGKVLIYEIARAGIALEDESAE